MAAGEEIAMNRRWFALSGVLGLGVVCSQLVTACASDRGAAKEDEFGTLSLPLGAYASSGTRYRLRNATFVIRDPYDSGSYGGQGGGSGSESIVVSSEDDLGADSIRLNVEQGSYRVTLQSGWHMEKREADGSYTRVEAQLLSSSSPWVYVYPRSTSWAEFSFGIGDREVWFNGNLNIDINVYEDPDDYYGGSGGYGWGSGGAPGSDG
jgi:hypothetical protein